MTYLVITISFFLFIILYFRIADHYNIIDHPNERSSHSEITIRGGGIIFLFAAIAIAILYPIYWLPVTGILIIGIISFLDDTLTLSSKLRLLFHLLAVTIMFLFLNVFQIKPFWICIPLYIMVIGIINMYNFMDGINGITGAYSLVVLAGLQYVNLTRTTFIEKDLIWIPMLSCVVFLYFNFRNKAKCFAGDVGSVTIAFWIIMLILRLIFVSHHWAYILFLVVYGVDSVLTIVHRIILKQNIFKAHRLHFYQLLANEQKIPHLWVAMGYVFLQGIITVILIVYINLNAFILFGVIIALLTIAYVTIKPTLMRGKRLGSQTAGL